MRGSPHGPGGPADNKGGGSKKPTSPVGPGAKGGDSTKDKLKDAASSKTTGQRLNEARQKGAKETAKVATTELVAKIATKFGVPPQVVRVVMVGVFGLISLMFTLLLMGVIVGVAGSFKTNTPYYDGAASKSPAAVKKHVPAKYTKDFKRASKRYGNVPWTLIAAIGQLATDNGQVAPYPEDTIDRDPKRDNLRTPGGMSAASAAGTSAPVSATDAKVYVLGDSVTVGVQDALKAKLQGAGWQVEVDAAVSRGLTAKGREGQPNGLDTLSAAVAAGKVGGTLVVALGNNGPDTVNAANIDQVLAKVPATTRVVWPTIAYGPGATGNPAAANAALLAAKANHPNLIVPDWRPNPAELDQYGHTKTDGVKAARVDLIANALGTYSAAPATTPATPAAGGGGLAAAMQKYIGIPYVYGGTDPAKGLDCSAFVQLVYKGFGVDLPRTTFQQVKVGQPVASINEAQPGDALFFGSDYHHVAIFMGNGQMAEAPRTGLSVRITAVRQPSTIRRFADPGKLTVGGTPAAPSAGNPAGLKVSTFPKVSPPIGTDQQAQGPFLIYPSAVSSSRINPQDVRSRGGRKPKTGTDWVASELNRIKNRLVRKEGWKFNSNAEKAAVWTEAVRQLAVADPNQASCTATIWDATLDEDVANAIEGLWSCELNYAPTLNVREVSSEDDELLKVDDPSPAVTREALQVAWAFSNWGQKACDDNADGPQGVFPLDKETFAKYAQGYDGKTRCDPLANIHAAVRAFIDIEKQKPGEGPRSTGDGAFNPVVGGWASMPWALGDGASLDKLRSDGPVAPATAPVSCATAVTTWLGTIAPSLTEFASVVPGTPVSDTDRTRLAEAVAALPGSPRQGSDCVGTDDGTWDRLVAEQAQAASSGYAQRELVSTPAPTDAGDPSAAVAGLTGFAEFHTQLAAAADSGTDAVPGTDSMVLRLSSSGRVLQDVPPLPVSTARISYAQQVVSLARAIGGISRRDKVPRSTDAWAGVQTPEGTVAPLALRIKAAPSGEALAGAAARSIGAPARGRQDNSGIRFVRRTFASIEAPPPPTDLPSIMNGGTAVTADQIMPGDVVIITFSNSATRVGIITSGGNYIYDPGDGTPVRMEPILTATPPPSTGDPPVTIAGAVVRRFLPPKAVQQAVAASPTAGGMTTGLSGFPDAAIQAAWDRWGPLYIAAGLQHGIDPLIPFAFGWQETGFQDVHIYCRRGLRPTWGNGIMQFTSATAASYQIDPCVPEQAIPAGTLFIKRLMDQNNGDLRLASMGYNAGPAISSAAAKCGCWPAAAFDKAYGRQSAWKQNITREYSGDAGVPGKYNRLKQYAQSSAPAAAPGAPAGPPTGNIVSVSGLSTGVDASIAPQVQAMFAAARAQGVNLSGSAWRSPARTAELRIKNGCPDVYVSPASSCRTPTARPGSSMHEKGLAIDFANCGRGSASFAWLQANAKQYGLYNLPSESWHWSTNGK
jgi:cell wall-associated NlpC family hydrolase